MLTEHWLTAHCLSYTSSKVVELARLTFLPKGLYIFPDVFCPTGLYILPSIISFFNLSQIISGSTGPIFTIFSPDEKYLREFSRSRPLFWFLYVRCHGNQFWAKFAKWPLFNMPAFCKGFEYRNSAFEVIESTICAIPCNFSEDWSVNRKNLAGSFCTFWDETAKIDIGTQVISK